MVELNSVMLAGNLVQDPTSRKTKSGSAICLMRVAVNRHFKGRDGERTEETCFLDVDVFGAQATPCMEHLGKGSAVLIEGRLRQDRWKDKETGQARSRIKAVADRVHFLDRHGNSRADDKARTM